MARRLFVNIQHPGENTAMADIADPTKYTSHWPGNIWLRRRWCLGASAFTATIVITKNDGGQIGY
jgi:uncharacterized protein